MMSVDLIEAYGAKPCPNRVIFDHRRVYAGVAINVDVDSQQFLTFDVWDFLEKPIDEFNEPLLVSLVFLNLITRDLRSTEV